MEKRMKKIIVYCDRWQNGGVESFLINQFRHWDRIELQVTLVTAEKTTEVYDEALQTLGIHHDVLLNTLHPPILRILKSLFRCNRYFRQHPCDVAYFHLTNGVTMLYVGFAKWAGATRRIVHSHCSGLEKSATRLLKLVAHTLAKKWFGGFATDFWGCSWQAIAFLFPQEKTRNALFIPNAIDTRFYAFSQHARQSVRAQLRCGGCFLVGTIGRCVPQKNQAFLLEVLFLLLKKRPNVRLLLVGDGPLLPKLKRKVERLGIQNACFFYGVSDDIPPLLSAMDAFCLPSVVEGLPVSAIEAQANGLPCFLADTIPRETALLPQTRYLPIGFGATQRWADALASVHAVKRSVGQMTVRAKGFDIRDCAERVQEALLKR